MSNNSDRGGHCRHTTCVLYLGVDGCPFETDPTWEVLWPNTPPDTTSIQRCPGGLESLGTV